VVLADSRRISRVRRYSGTPTGVRLPFAYGAVTHCGAPFQNASARYRICNSVKGLVPLLSGPTTPTWQRHQALPPDRFRLFPFRSPLLRESLLLSIPRGTEMFQFPRFPPLALCVQTRVTPNYGCRVSPFGHPRIEAWSAAPRGFSQPPTSFIGIRRLGIHRWPLVAWNGKDARARYGILKERLEGRADAPLGRARTLPCIDEIWGPNAPRQRNSGDRPRAIQLERP